MMRRFPPLQKAFFALVALAVLAAAPVASARADASCPLPANQPIKTGGKKNKKKQTKAAKRKAKKKAAKKSRSITLKPESTSEIINFGGTRGTKSIDIVLLASHPLPKTFSVKQLELDSPKQFSRSSQTLDSAGLPLPRFSNPQLIEHRKKIRLRLCIDTTGAQAGTYTGTVFISGPPGITSTSITVTANIKTRECLFLLFLIFALLGAFLLLLFKAAKEVREGDEAAKKADSTKAVTTWRAALLSSLTDPTFVVSTVIALGAALVAMRAIYDSTPAWGADTWTNAFALCGTAFGAAGVGSLITAFTPKST